MAKQMKATRKVRYAVAGLGWISQTALLPGFANARRNSEAVYIGLPNHLHADYTIRAAKAGVHVLCEKPMAVTETECRRMIRACDDNGVKLMIAYRLHFEPANLSAVELGEPRIFVSTFTQDVEPGNVRLEPVEKGGGPVYDVGVYCINAARYLLRAEPTSVYATMAHGRDKRFDDSEEMASVVMRFPDGRLASFTCSFSTEKVSTYSVIGTEGTLTLDPAYSHSSPLRYELNLDGKMRTKEFKPVDQFGAQLHYFSDCILKNRKPEPSGEEGLIDVRIIRAIHRSAKIGRPVSLDLKPKIRRPRGSQKISKPVVPEPKMVHAEAPGG